MNHPYMRIVQRLVVIACAGAVWCGCGQFPATTNISASGASTASSAPVGSNATTAEASSKSLDRDHVPVPTDAPTADGATTGDHAPARGIDPCLLVTKADAEAVLDEAVQDDPVRSESFPHGCQYLAEHTLMRSASVSLITSPMLKDGGSPYTTTQYYANMKQAATVEPVAGVGNEAAWITMEGVAPQLWVVHGDVLLMVDVGAPTEENKRTPTEAFAKLVVARLP